MVLLLKPAFALFQVVVLVKQCFVSPAACCCDPTYRAPLIEELVIACVQWRVQGEGPEARYYGANPDEPYGDARIVSVQPDLIQDTTSGLNSTMYWIESIQTYGPAVRYTVRLSCDRAQTPWCERHDPP